MICSGWYLLEKWNKKRLQNAARKLVRREIPGCRFQFFPRRPEDMPPSSSVHHQPDSCYLFWSWTSHVMSEFKGTWIQAHLHYFRIMMHSQMAVSFLWAILHSVLCHFGDANREARVGGLLMVSGVQCSFELCEQGARRILQLLEHPKGAFPPACLTNAR